VKSVSRRDETIDRIVRAGANGVKEKESKRYKKEGSTVVFSGKPNFTG
jgi:hypothetical protein